MVSQKAIGREEAIDVPARIRQIEQRPAAAPQQRPAKRRVVAKILSDGSVRPVGGSEPVDFPKSPFTSGRLTGEDWVLWWERRAWPGEGE